MLIYCYCNQQAVSRTKLTSFVGSRPFKWGRVMIVLIVFLFFAIGITANIRAALRNKTPKTDYQSKKIKSSKPKPACELEAGLTKAVDKHLRSKR